MFNLLKKKEDKVVEGVFSPTFSPAIKEAIDERLMDFPKAIQKVIEGRKVTRVYWKNAKIYGELKDNVLKIRLANGQFDGWLLSDGDLKAEDWLEI